MFVRLHAVTVWSVAFALLAACHSQQQTHDDGSTTSGDPAAGGQGGQTEGAVTGSTSTGGQGGGTVQLETWELDWLTWIDMAIASAPQKDSEGFVIPDGKEMSSFALAAQALRDGDVDDASERASEVDYQVVDIRDTGDAGSVILALLPQEWTPSKATGGHGRGMFFIRPFRVTDMTMALSAPHPLFDRHTGVVAANAFRQLRARSLSVAGTHRCANKSDSGCSGSTTVCGYSTYRQSDMAHMDRGFFQVFHEVMDSDAQGAIQHVQVHGFKSTETDPEFSISAGTTTNYEDASFSSNRLAVNLAAYTAMKGSQKPGNSCNQPGDINRLCGSTNTQGRYTNGVDGSATCTMSSGGYASGRFIHAELSIAIRSATGAIGPQVFIDALQDTF